MALKPLKREDPPAVQRKGTRRGSKYDPIIEELKANPGVRFKVLEDVTTSTARVFVQAGCGYTTRKSESDRPNRVDIWAWYPADSAGPDENGAVRDGDKKPAARKTPAKKTAAKKAPAKRPTAKKK